MQNKALRKNRRKNRVRRKIDLTSKRQYRLSIDRSCRHISCQLIDMKASNTILSSSTKNKGLKKENSSHRNTNMATKVGDDIGKKIKQHGIEKIVFDRGGYKYHGVVKSFAEAVRQHVEF